MKDSKYDMVRVNYMHMYIQIDDYCLALLSRLSTPYLVSRFPKPLKQIINCLFFKIEPVHIYIYRRTYSSDQKQV